MIYQEQIKSYVNKLSYQVRNSEIKDTELAHREADNILCCLLKELGFGRVVEEYNKVGKWYA